MPQLALGDEHCVEDFLELRVSGLGIAEDLTHIVYRPLDLQSVSLLFPFYHERGAKHLRGHRYVEKEWFPIRWRNKDRGAGQ